MRRRVRILRLAAAILAAAARPVAAAGVEALLRDESAWTTPARAFLLRHRDFPWEWVDEGRAARVAREGPTFAGRRVWEILAYFEDDRPRRLVVSLYNRGDAGAMNEAEFDALLAAAAGALEAWAGAPSSPVRDERVAANARAASRFWTRGPHRAALEWSTSRPRGPDGRAAFRAEYVRVVLAPAGAAAEPAPPPAAADSRARVRRSPDGVVRLDDVPMVDQGDKGYCAVAVIERVLRFYGQEFDQHQAAQLAGTTAAGTATDALAEAARRIAARFRLSFRDLQETDVPRLVDDYNRLARRAREPVIETGRSLHVPTVYAQMKPALLREARLDGRAERRRFFQHVRESVDRGAPVIWSVMLGLVPEEPRLPQASGGHLRLIVGYHEERQEIFYSDSWGRGHEFKRMGADDAWTITTGLYAILPR